ncbi:hypothetical protein MXB_2890 [Myxobolus squamalis]|nr:hypothetical protein MXB_2890 [Myxobolus squamalis]
MGLDSDEILKKFVNKKLFKNMKNQSLLVLKNKKTNEISRIRRSYPHENYLRKIIHPNPSFINRFILSKPIHNIIGFKRTPNDTNEFDQEEAHWMIPHTLKGRCRVLLNIIDILNDLLKTIHHLKLNQKKSTDIFNKQKLNLLLNKDYYLQKLKDSGDQLNLIIGEQNNSFFHITSRFSQGVDIYIRNLEESLSEIEVVVMNEWRKSLTDRIKKMGGKGIERFIQNLNDVIKTLLKTKPDTNSLFTQIQKQNSDIILLMVKNIKSAILEQDFKKDANSMLTKEYDEAKKLKRIIKSTCH